MAISCKITKAKKKNPFKHLKMLEGVSKILFSIT
jgi:hypothetical protein